MPQDFNVLRCYKCKTFQVHIAKKTNKWTCKICDEKQSIKRVYGKGTGKECRLHVQKMNNMRMLKEDEDKPFARFVEKVIEEVEEEKPVPGNSQWSRFIETEVEIDAEEDNNVLNGCRVVLEIEKKTKSRKIEPKLKIRDPICKKQMAITKISQTATDNEESFENDANVDNYVKPSPPKRSPKKQIIKTLKNIALAHDSKWSKFVSDDDIVDVPIEDVTKDDVATEKSGKDIINIFMSDSAEDLDDILNF